MTVMDSLFPHAATTEGITVRVAVSYLPEQSAASRLRWFWAYHIRIENGSDHTVQLLSRHWEITDGRGAIQHVDGEGVVGEQPILAPGASHDYVSGCPLSTSSGHMEGSFLMIDENRRAFDIAIPRFPLRAPAVAR